MRPVWCGALPFALTRDLLPFNKAALQLQGCQQAMVTQKGVILQHQSTATS